MSEAKERVRLGCDPELFLLDAKGNFFPGCGLTGGTKDKPVDLAPLLKAAQGVNFDKYSVKQLQGVGLLEDGVAVELNTPSSADSESFQNIIYGAYSGLRSWAGAKGLSLSPANTMDVPDAVWSQHPTARELGCMPDYSAYKGDLLSPPREREVPSDVVNSSRRYSGGHIHLGYEASLTPAPIMARFMDLVVGLPLLVWGGKQGERGLFYGQAGIFRTKKYGVEYRTPTNFWVRHCHRGELTHMFRRVLLLGQWASTNVPVLQTLFKAVNWNEVETALQTDNQQTAFTITSQLYTQFPELFGHMGTCSGPADWDNPSKQKTSLFTKSVLATRVEADY